MKQLNLFSFNETVETPKPKEIKNKPSKNEEEIKENNDGIFYSNNTYQPELAPPISEYLNKWQPKDTAKLDKETTKVLEHGWLLPYLYQIDSLTNQRWQHWVKANQVKQKDLIIYTSQGLSEEFINRALFVHRYPVLAFKENPTITAYLYKILSLIQTTKGFDILRCFNYFMDWLLYGFGHEKFIERCSDTQVDFQMDYLLYQYFDLSVFLAYPFDYFGLIGPELFPKRNNSACGYYPTPMTIIEMMIKISFKSGISTATIAEPSAGTGTVPLGLSNNIFCASTIELQDTLTKAMLVNYYFYCPCFVRPLWYFVNRNSIQTGNSLSMKIRVDYLKDYRQTIYDSMDGLPLFS